MKQTKRFRTHRNHMRKIFALAMAFCMTLALLPSAGEAAYALESTQVANACEPASTPEYNCGYEPANITEDPDIEVRASDGETSYGGKLRFNAANTTTITEIDKTEIRYCRSKLDEDSHLISIYNAIRDGLNAYESSIQIEDVPSEGSEYTKAEVELAYYLVREDYPELFWMDGYKSTCYTYKADTSKTEYVSAITPNYTFGSLKATKSAKSQMNSVINSAFSDLYACNGYETYSKYDKELWIHDYIAKTTEYEDEASNKYTAYGALVEHEAVCEGYTRAFQLLMHKLGIECTNIIGSSDGENVDHIWSAVKLDDGNWYQVDLTWDDHGTDDMEISYRYFNIMTTTMEIDHYIMDDANFVDIPECTEVEWWYFNVNSYDIVSKIPETDEEIDELGMKIAGEINDNGYARLFVPTDQSNFATLYMFEANLDYYLGELGEAVLKHMYIEGDYWYGEITYGPEDSEIILYMYPDSDSGEVYAADVWDKIWQDNNLEDTVIRAYPYNTTKAEIASLIKKDVGNKATQDYKCQAEASVSQIGILDGLDVELYQGMFLFEGISLGTYTVAIYKPGTPIIVYTLTVAEGGISWIRAVQDNAWWLNRFGVVDDDWEVSAIDALVLRRNIAEWGGAYDSIDTLTADINGDGEVNMEDLLILEKHIAGWEEYKDLSLYYKVS